MARESYEELVESWKGDNMSGKSLSEEEIKQRRHEYYLKRKAEGKIPKQKYDPEAAHRRYLKKKAELKAQGLSTYHMGKGQAGYNPEKRAEYYQKWKAEGKTQKYYQEAKAKDPLFNQKAHIRRKKANIQWQTVKGERATLYYWTVVIEMIRESDLPVEELAQKLVKDWRICKNQHTKKDEKFKTIYRPRITSSALTEKEIEELDNYALSQGLTSQHELIKSTVSYFGDLLDIDSREENKEVDIYTKQERDKDYSEDEKLHTVSKDYRCNYKLLAKRERERE